MIKGKYVIKNDLPKEAYDEIKADLTTSINDLYGDVKQYCIWRERDEYIQIPRFYKNDILTKYIKSEINTPKEVEFKFLGKLNEKQKKISEICIEKIKQKNGGTIILPCGSGKTVIALYIASELKLKTLAITHKTFLQDQWMERIKQFTTAKIGMIRQKYIDVNDKEIVVGMLQSISLIEYPDKIFSDFGLVLYDEAHHIVAEKFSNALYKIHSPYVVGLTATPERKGNLTDMLYYLLGQPLYKEKSQQKEFPVIVKRIHYDIKHPKFVEKLQYFKGKFLPSVTKMIKNLISIEERNVLIINMIYNVWKLGDRKILVLSERIMHLETLKEMLDNLIKKKVSDNEIIDDECTTGFYIGRCSALERKCTEDCSIIFGSYDMCKEAVDFSIPPNTLFLVTSKPDSGLIKQACGRIMRKQNKEAYDGVYPIIVDFNDQFSIFPKQGAKREKVYVKEKYVIENYNAVKDVIYTRYDYYKNVFKFTDEEIQKLHLENIDFYDNIK